MTAEPYNGKKMFVLMISEIMYTTIDNINEVKIRSMNYLTKITVIINSELKFISPILLDFQIFSLVRKQHNTIFHSFMFKVSIHKVFHQHILKVFHIIF